MSRSLTRIVMPAIKGGAGKSTLAIFLLGGVLFSLSSIKEVKEYLRVNAGRSG
ncbi:hypothetical protein L3N51_01606 [Metallosphaera sp. J1]|uniref:hypothetical protein n=1 Tax=Metallosphaera javensis (ex Hofmann et al. 2022) TaxID=99938 RepID=UPI001EDFDB85|nr:hypothetical protein [Metallosphaera javensis (ex Hofmann et al. 2022)]MCG3109316.1 hypothetical protein [Metallosphaera javensis (ex Hofmann et al. 2022)]